MLRWTNPESRRRVSFPLHDRPPNLLIGRKDGASVQISDRRMSRAHATLRFVDGVWILKDINSTLGTQIAREGHPWRRVSDEISLRDGDRLRLGDTVIEYFDPPEFGEADDAGIYSSDAIIELTPREQEVLEALCQAAFNGEPKLPSYEEIAGRLKIKISTVRTHVKHLFRKFDVGDRARLVGRAIDEGWVSPPRDGGERA